MRKTVSCLVLQISTNLFQTRFAHSYLKAVSPTSLVFSVSNVAQNKLWCLNLGVDVTERGYAIFFYFFFEGVPGWGYNGLGLGD